jgi:hypothetical protein
MTTLAVTLRGEGTGVSGTVKFEEARGQGEYEGEKETGGAVLFVLAAPLVGRCPPTFRST